MSTPKDNATSRRLNGKDFEPVKTTGVDIMGEYPIPGYSNASSVNSSARSEVSENGLDIAGTAPGIDISKHTGGIESQYPLNQVIETASGHVIEYNDTPENPRILIKHTEGSGVDLRPDGTIVVSSKGDGMVEVHHGGHKMVVTGDGQLHYSGNLTMNIGGDFNLNVAGSFAVQAREETKTILGPSRDMYLGSKYTTISGSRQDVYTQSHTAMVLGNKTEFVKGNMETGVEGTATHAVKGDYKMTSESKVVQTSPDINIAAQNLSVFGATGNIGGDGIIMHNYNMFTGHSIEAGDTIYTQTANIANTINTDKVTATSFHGDLFGTATAALAANVAAAPGGGGATQSASGATDVANDNTGETDRADAAMMAEYMGQGAYAVQPVTIDAGNHFKNSINWKEYTGGVTAMPMTVTGIRAKKRDDSYNTNEKFNSYTVSSGMLNRQHNNTVPPAVTTTRDPNKLAGGSGYASALSDAKARVVAAIEKTKKIVVEKKFDINNYEVIIPQTLLDHGVAFSQFIYGKGNPGRFDPTINLEERKQILRNLLPQAQFLKRIRSNNDEFKSYNVEVIEGIYSKEIFEDGSEETLTTDGILDLRTKGRAVVYEVVGPDGVVDPDKTFELATWIAKNLHFEKMILDYDKFDPSGTLNVQIVLIMPEIPATYQATYNREVETRYNNKVQDSSLLKIEEKPAPGSNLPPEDPNLTSEKPDVEPF